MEERARGGPRAANYSERGTRITLSGELARFFASCEIIFSVFSNVIFSETLLLVYVWRRGKCCYADGLYRIGLLEAGVGVFYCVRK